MNGLYVGIDIGGTKCAVSIAHGPTEIVRKSIIPTDLTIAPVPYLESLAGEVRSLMAEEGVTADNLESVGIVCGGPLDLHRGLICSPPNLPGWDDVPVVKLFEQEFEVPVQLLNDADACALAEWQFGAGKGCANVVFLTFGTGMGAGLILDGRLYLGASGYAGEVGRLRLSTAEPERGIDGTFEGYCSGNGIARRARAVARRLLETNSELPLFCKGKSKLDDVQAYDVAEAAAEGDIYAVEVFRETGTFLGLGLSAIIDLFNPDRIVIGGIYERRESLLREPATRVVEEKALEPARRACSVVPSGLGERVGDTAALMVATGSHRTEKVV